MFVRCSQKANLVKTLQLKRHDVVPRLHTANRIWDEASGRTTDCPQRSGKMVLDFFFEKILEDMSPFCGAIDTPVLDFW